ncbi:MAG: inositol-3-phosphate synthase [Candidatus Diapherotrites archaeon]|nr:inositol-3-phosphate synthase [Candidatus Diapherotrites archaeon]
MSKIRVAISGIGNCASSLIQGRYYYKDVSSNDELVPGLMHNVFGGYKIDDIEFVAAFDIDKRKVGKDLSEAIFAKPNCTKTVYKDIPKQNVIVKKGPVLDGFPDHMLEYPEDKRFMTDDTPPVDVVKELKKSKADMLVNYMPVGSQKATEFYAQAALDAGIAFVNCMPVFIASDPEGKWPKKFEEAGLPVVGDDIKSQIGATIVHRVLTKLFNDRGVKLDKTYQLNVGGNTDFMNLIEHSRGKTKKISKTESVQSQLPVPMAPDTIHIGPSDYVPWLKDNKLCFLRMEGRKFGDIPVELELRLSVEDSPNSAGCVIDAIRACKIALDRKVSGPLISMSSYIMKHPPQQYPDFIAKQMVEDFIKGERER